MHRRTFCKSTIAAAVAATLPACGSSSSSDSASSSTIAAISADGDELSLESAALS